MLFKCNVSFHEDTYSPSFAAPVRATRLVVWRLQAFEGEVLDPTLSWDPNPPPSSTPFGFRLN